MHFPKQASALLLSLLGVSSQAKAKEHTTFSPVPMYRRMQEAIELPLVGATQSCSYPVEFGQAMPAGDASKAIDGDTNGHWFGGSVAHTCTDPGDKWLEIDLDPDYNYIISKIRIHNRVNCCQSRLLNTYVQILNAENDVIASKKITDVGDTPANPDAVDVAFEDVTGGKSVRLFKNIKPYNEEIIINVAEVRVFGVSSTNSPTKTPTNSPTKSPTNSPTKTPTNSPTKSPTNSPTKTPTNSPTKSPTNSPTPAAAAPISSWALEFDSLSSDFDKDSVSEVTINYKIGAGRTYQVDILKKGCEENITGAVITPTSSTSSIEGDPSHSNVQVSLDIQKDTIANSNIIDGNTLELCVRVGLTSNGSGELKVIKKLETNVDIELKFDANFETVADAQFGQISLESQGDEAEVGNYIDACTCNDKESFTCNTNVLGPDDFLNVCIKSADTEMEINYLDSLKMTQGENTLDIVQEEQLVDGTISSMSSVKSKNGVHVATVIPASFFSYNGDTSAQVSGVVYLKLKGSRRRLAVEITGQPEAQATDSTALRALQAESTGGAEQESTFAIEVKLEKNELGLGEATDANGAFDTGSIVVAAAAIASAVAVVMW